MTLIELGLSRPVRNTLERARITRAEDLDGKTEDELLDLRWFGVKSLDELNAALARAGLPLPRPAVLPLHGMAVMAQRHRDRGEAVCAACRAGEMRRAALAALAVPA